MKVRNPALAPLALAAVLMIAPGELRGQTDEAAVIEAAEALFEAIAARDGDLARSVLHPQAVLLPIRISDGKPVPGDRLTGGAWTSTIEAEGPALVERMWDPVVEVSGSFATLWAPYDFYRDGELSHCGIDAFQLVKSGDRWRILVVTWTSGQPPACETHPNGPPS